MAADDKKDQHSNSGKEAGKLMDRRDLLQGVATVPVLGLFGYALNKQMGYEQAHKAALASPAAPAAKLSEINVALLDAGAQGEVLLSAMLKIPGLRDRAVCDIWTEYSQKRLVNQLRKFKFNVNGYEEIRQRTSGTTRSWRSMSTKPRPAQPGNTHGTRSILPAANDGPGHPQGRDRLAFPL